MLFNVIACPLLAIGEFDTNTIEGSGILKNESRKISSFTSINIRGSYELQINSQQSPNLELIGDDNILPLIVTEIRDNTLFIYTPHNIAPKNQLKVKTASQNIKKVSAEGANRVEISNLNNETFSLIQSGTSKSEIFGKTRELYVKLSGSVDVRGEALYAKKAKIDLFGASKVDVYVTEILNARVFGVGTINYYGNPLKVVKNILGVGFLNKK